MCHVSARAMLFLVKFILCKQSKSCTTKDLTRLPLEQLDADRSIKVEITERLSWPLAAVLACVVA